MKTLRAVEYSSERLDSWTQIKEQENEREIRVDVSTKYQVLNFRENELRHVYDVLRAYYACPEAD